MEFKNNPPQKEIVIRAYTSGDEGKITDMFNEVFLQSRDIKHWYWKYMDNPYGRSIISLAVACDGNYAAHYAAYPLKLSCCGRGDTQPRLYTAYHAGDKMTRKKFRAAGFGRGSILTMTYNHFRETPVEPDTIFKFGFMTHHSLRFGLLFFDYTVIEDVPYWKASLEELARLKADFTGAATDSINVEEVLQVDDRWTDLFSRTAPDYGCLVRRDETHLKWRYIERPDRKYLIFAVTKGTRLAGWSVFYREGDRLLWGDALFERGGIDCLKAMLVHVYSHPVFSGAKSIEGWFPARPDWWGAMLIDAGFRAETEPNNLRFCIGNIVNSAAFDIASKHFYYTMGDSDLF